MRNQYLIVLPFFLTLTACYEPTTVSFSRSFNRAFNNYKPVRNSQEFLIMNYESHLIVNKDNEFEVFYTYFFEEGVKIIKHEPTSIILQQQKVRKHTEYIFDYQEEGVFELFYYDEVYSNFQYKSFYSIEASDLNNELSLLMLFEELFIKQKLIDQINWQVDLVIPSEPINDEVLDFEIPISDVIKLENFEPAIGFIPHSVYSDMTLVQATEKVTLNFEAMNSEITYEMKLDLYNLNELDADNFLLSESEKLEYTGY